MNIDWDIILRYLNDECSEEEIRKVEQWRGRSEYNRQLLFEMKQIWEVAPEEDHDVDAAKAWDRFQQGIIDKSRDRDKKSGKGRIAEGGYRKHRRLYAPHLYRMAAVLLIGVFMSGIYLWYKLDTGAQDKAHEEVVMQTISTDPGEKAGVTFSDGTEIILNADSRVRFPREFNDKQRLVYLDGEAYFKVAHNDRLPFIVQTAKARVRVLGTQFNVRAWDEDTDAEVAVREGTVRVQATDTTMVHPSVILQKGQQTLLAEGSKELTVEDVDVKKNLLWINGGMYFNNDSFRKVLKILERRYNVSFRVEDKHLLSVPYTGEFQKANLDKVLKVLSVSMEVEFSRKDNYIFVQKDNK